MPKHQGGFASAVCRDWRHSMSSPFKSRIRSIFEFVISTPAVYLALSHRWDSVTVTDYLLRGAISILVSGAVVLITNALWAFVAAPRRVFYRQKRQIDILSSKLVRATEGDKSGFKMVPAQLGDVKEILDNIMADCPRGDRDQEFSGFMTWYTTTGPQLREVIRGPQYKRFQHTAEKYIDGPCSSVLNRTPSAFTECIRCLLWIRNEVGADDINPDFQVKRRA